MRRLLDAITGKALTDAVEENKKTQSDIKDAVKKAREKIDAERNAAEAAGRK